MKYNGMRRYPRLALWAGAGVLLFAAALAVNCDDGGSAEKPGVNGYMYAAYGNVNEDAGMTHFVVFDAATGMRSRTVSCEGCDETLSFYPYDIDEVTGDIYLLRTSEIQKYKPSGAFVYGEYYPQTYWNDKIKVDYRNGRLWVFEDDRAGVADTATGEIIKWVPACDEGTIYRGEGSAIIPLYADNAYYGVVYSADGNELNRYLLWGPYGTLYQIVCKGDGSFYVFYAVNGDARVAHFSEEGAKQTESDLPDGSWGNAVVAADGTLWAIGKVNILYRLASDGSVKEERSAFHYYDIELDADGKTLFVYGYPSSEERTPIYEAWDATTAEVKWRITGTEFFGILGWAAR